MALTGILLRNATAFVATAIIPLWQSKFGGENQFQQDQRIQTNAAILTLDVIMTHKLPFNYFKS